MRRQLVSVSLFIYVIVAIIECNDVLGIIRRVELFLSLSLESEKRNYFCSIDFASCSSLLKIASYLNYIDDNLK